MAEDEEDPDFLSNLLGGFNEATYEDDLENFPDYFDENGWPLFGVYDPYTLKHPITGVSWHISPRVPTNNETDPDYEDWFELAQRFSNSRLVEHIRAKPNVPKENPNTSNILYGANSKNAADGNLAYLRTHVLSELTELFEQKTSSSRFALLWGEYCGILESIGVAVIAMNRRQSGREIGRSSQSKDAQVKWYLHWRRRHVDELGKSLRTANFEFKGLVDQIVNEKVTCPDGFSVEWFRKTQSKYSKKSGSSEWGLARAFSTSNLHPLKSEFLKQSPTDEPKIPSVELNGFQ